VQVVLGQVTLAVQEHHSERNNRHACRLFCCSAVRWCTEVQVQTRRRVLDGYAQAPGLQQGISFICKYHLIAEVLGCQCKWCLGRSPLLCRSTTMNRTTARLPFSIAMVYGRAGPNLMQSFGWLCIPFICKYHLIAEAPGCQCKWYLSHLCCAWAPR